jgi:hypothetical protein
VLRARLPAAALKWIDAVRSDVNYKKVKEARRRLTHAKLPRHWKFAVWKRVPERLELELTIDDKTTKLGPRDLIKLARDVATKHITALVKELPNLYQKEQEPKNSFAERKRFLEDLDYVLKQAKAFGAYWQTNADALLEDHPIRQIIRNAVLESSLCFLRKVNEFFGESPREISVCDYLPSEPKQYLFSKEDSILLNQRVMHLSLEEARQGKYDWEDFLKRHVPEAEKRYNAFLEKLHETHPEYFHPDAENHSTC